MNAIEIVKDVVLPVLTFAFGFYVARRGLIDPHRHALYQKQLEAAGDLLAASGGLLGSPNDPLEDNASSTYRRYVKAFEKWRVYLPDYANDALIDFHVAAAKIVDLYPTEAGENKYQTYLDSRRKLEAALRRLIGVEPLSDETSRAISTLEKQTRK